MSADRETTNRHYLLRRAQQEKAKADASTDIAARAVHLELTERYLRRAEDVPSILQWACD